MGEHGRLSAAPGRSDDAEAQTGTVPGQHPAGDERLPKTGTRSGRPMTGDADDKFETASLFGGKVTGRVFPDKIEVCIAPGLHRCHLEGEHRHQRRKRHGSYSDLRHEPPPTHHHQVGQLRGRPNLSH